MVDKQLHWESFGFPRVFTIVPSCAFPLRRRAVLLLPVQYILFNPYSKTRPIEMATRSYAQSASPTLSMGFLSPFHEYYYISVAHAKTDSSILGREL
jgi:hypothetical protein